MITCLKKHKIKKAAKKLNIAEKQQLAKDLGDKILQELAQIAWNAGTDLEGEYFEELYQLPGSDKKVGPEKAFSKSLQMFHDALANYDLPALQQVGFYVR